MVKVVWIWGTKWCRWAGLSVHALPWLVLPQGPGAPGRRSGETDDEGWEGGHDARRQPTTWRQSIVVVVAVEAEAVVGLCVCVYRNLSPPLGHNSLPLWCVCAVMRCAGG